MKKSIAMLLIMAATAAQAQNVRIVKMDTHSHVDVPMVRENMPGQKVDIKAAMAKAGMDGLGMTFAVDYVPLKTEGQAYERFYNAMEGQDSILAQSGVRRVLNADDLEQAVSNGEPFVVQCVEGGHFLEGDVSRIAPAYERGLRIFCLLHDNDASPALGDVYTNEPQFGGLTELGAATIRECNRLGILVDLAHCDSTTLRMALRESKVPVIISHTGLVTRLGSNDFMGNMMKKRLISPALAKEVADAGGVIGVWPHLAYSAKEYAENIKAMVDIVGIDHVCIGTDTKVTLEVNEITPEMMEEFRKREAEKQNREGGMRPDGERRHGGEKGSGGPGGDKGRGGQRGNFPKKDPNAVNHVWQDDAEPFYPSVIRELKAIGYNDAEIGKLTGENFIRVFRLATEVAK